MTLTDLHVKLTDLEKASAADAEILKDVLEIRKESAALFAEEKYTEALETTVKALRRLREMSDYSRLEFREVLAALLFDLSEIHFQLKDFKQSERELETLFKVLDQMIKTDPERYARYHVLAMELSTRILRSRKKTLELLAKQQINTGQLYDKVNSGVAAATDKLVESLRKGADMLAQTGDYNGAVKFYAEAIKLAKKRSGKVTRREIRMTIDMARLMMKSKSQRPRAERLLNAVLPHAIALETLELEQEILSLLRKSEEDVAHEPMWRSFLEKVHRATVSTVSRFRKKEENEEPEEGKEETEDKK